MISIDLENGTVRREKAGTVEEHALDTPEAFAIVSDAWLRCGWDTKYVYTFTWLGRPVIQLPEDMLRVQEVLWQVKPDVLIETGVAHGGSLVFYASLFKAMERGRVIGVDIEIRPHNRKAIEEHFLKPYITLVEGSSIDPGVVDTVRQMIRPGERVMVMLDSCHSRSHVLAELEAYSPLVSEGSYIVAADGIMKDLKGAPRSHPDWDVNNPYYAAEDFMKRHPEFEQCQPPWQFNESVSLRDNVTYWPGAYLRRRPSGA